MLYSIHTDTADSLVLTRRELIQLTGFTHRNKQIEVLVYMDIRFRLTPTGDIKVLHSDLYTDRRRATIKSMEPDFEAIKVPK